MVQTTVGTSEPGKSVLDTEAASESGILGCDGTGLVSERDPGQYLNKILRRVFPGAVICLHDGRGENGAPGKNDRSIEKSNPIVESAGV